MRDRSKRRKQQPEKQGQDQQPAPLQPRFPDPIPDDIGNRVEGYEPPPPSMPDDEEQPVPAQTGGGDEPPSRPPRDRNRRRGRRGRGGRPQTPAPTTGPALSLPAPGGPTGEGSEADASPEVNDPVAASRPPAPHESKKSKGAVVLSIGLPGSGKSTWFKRHSILPLSSDMVRILLFDDVTEQRFQDLVFSTLRSMLRARLLARRPWNYVDATNLSPHERRSWIKLAHDFGYEAHAVFFDVPPEVCIERNRRRERNVPEDVMMRMAGKLRPPKFEEGFAKITVVRLKKKEGEAPAEESRTELPMAADEGERPEPVEPVDSEY